MPNAHAKLRFQTRSHRAGGTEEWGEIVLYTDGTLRLTASGKLKARFLRTADRVDKAALLYGAGAFMGITGVGTALVMKRKSFWGYLVLAFAALVALGGSRLRTVARNAPQILDSILSVNSVGATISPEGGLTIILSDKPWKGATLRFEAGEFNHAQATEFIHALRKYSPAIAGK